MTRLMALMLLFSVSAAYGEVYTWKDVKGTEFYTNSLHEIPARYPKRAKVLDVATGKKGGLASEQLPPKGLVQGPAANPAPSAPPLPTSSFANPSPPAASPPLSGTGTRSKGRQTPPSRAL
jgi:hypothetical protein